MVWTILEYNSVICTFIIVSYSLKYLNDFQLEKVNKDFYNLLVSYLINLLLSRDLNILTECKSSINLNLLDVCCIRWNWYVNYPISSMYILKFSFVLYRYINNNHSGDLLQFRPFLNYNVKNKRRFIFF